MKNGKLSDKKWNEFVSGDVAIFKGFYTSYFDELYTYGFKIHSNEDFAKDCVQDVFVEFYERRSFLSKPKNLRNYLYQSVRNKAYRKLERERKYHEFKIDNSKYISEDYTFNEENSERNKKILSSLIKNLSAKQQEILFLRFSQGFDYDEIGDLLGIDKSSVRKQVYRAIKKIRSSKSFSRSLEVVFLLITFPFNR